MAFQVGESGTVTLKAVLIGVIVLLLLVPLGMLRGLVTERSSLREQAYARVAQGWGGSAVLGGPMLVVPTQRTVIERIDNKDVARIIRSDLYLLPARLDMAVDLQQQDDARYVGIYAVQVYLADVHFKGEFEFAALQPLLDKPGVTYLWHQSRLRLPVSEVRSLREVSRATFAGQAVKLGPAQPGLYGGIEARIDLTELARTSSAAFEFGARIAGSRSLSLLPLGSTTTLQMHSNWPHPSFYGGFLPAERTITAEGFDARWQVLELNRTYRQAFSEEEVTQSVLDESAFGVSLYQTVDVYQRSERAVKYALLFIALTFLTFFAWEQITRNPLHPLQYLLIGLALSIFYLLLIALSEHISFAAAYLVAAAALVVLIGVYIAGALRSSMRGGIAAAAMSAVYALLYALVLSEDYALLLGAIVLFVALAAVMLVTRRIDWYRLGPRLPSASRQVLTQMARDARTAVAMSFMVKKGGHERAARIDPEPEPARAGRELAAGLAQLVSEPVRRSRGPGADSGARVLAFVIVTLESPCSRATGSTAGVQREVDGRGRARAAAPADPPATHAAASAKPAAETATEEVAPLSWESG